MTVTAESSRTARPGAGGVAPLDAGRSRRQPPLSRYKSCMNGAENERLRRIAFAAQDDCAKMQAKCVEQWVENYQQRVRLDAVRQRSHALRDRNLVRRKGHRGRQAKAPPAR